MEVIGDKILGSWRLEKWIYENEAGDEIKYFSESPSGILIYEPSGYMSVQIQQSGRANFESQTLDGGTIKEKSGAFGSYLAYYGQFVEHNPGEFTHTVEGSLFPNWVGHEEIRYAKIERDLLTLSTPPIPTDDGDITFKITWRRI